MRARKNRFEYQADVQDYNFQFGGTRVWEDHTGQLSLHICPKEAMSSEAYQFANNFTTMCAVCPVHNFWGCAPVSFNPDNTKHMFRIDFNAVMSEHIQLAEFEPLIKEELAWMCGYHRKEYPAPQKHDGAPHKNFDDYRVGGRREAKGVGCKSGKDRSACLVVILLCAY